MHIHLSQHDEQIYDAISSTAERNRLVRFCTRFTGDRDVAEDLVQETLVTAWRRCDQVTDPSGIDRWLTTIAHNHCRHWLRSQRRRHKYMADPNDFGPMATSTSPARAADHCEIAAEFDLDLELERVEIVALLDRALMHLPVETQTLLVNHYVKTIPHAELGAQLGIKAGAVAGRLQRGKAALRRLLVTQFCDDALALGLIPAETVGWQRTRIWCPSCGQRRLDGLFTGDGEQRQLRLRCTCGMNSCTSGVAELFAGIRSIRPALTRAKQWWHTFWQDGLRGGQVACLQCGRMLPLHLTLETPVPTVFGPRPTDEQGLWTHCPTCNWGKQTDLEALASSFPAAIRFWRNHPRIKTLPVHSIEYNGAPASVIRYQAINDTAELDLIFHSITFVLLNSS